MPRLDPSLPAQKISHLTKSLRDRSASVTSLLGIAQSLLSGSPSVNFPHRGDWLLEWLAQRMKEDDEPETRTSPEVWQFLLKLFNSVEDSSIVAGILRRHSIVSILARTMAELRAGDRPCSSIANPSNILSGFTSVFLHLQELSKRESSVAVAMKASIEVGATLLRDCLAVIRALLAQSLPVQDEYVNTVLNIWRTSIWGNPNTKKISAVWSATCLEPASSLLVTSGLSKSLKASLEDMVYEYIFSPDIIIVTSSTSNSAPISNELRHLLTPLHAKGPSTPENTYCSSAALFQIALTAQRKKQSSNPDPAIVEMILHSLLAVVDGVDLSTAEMVTAASSDSIAALLQVLADTGSNLPVSALVKIVDTVVNFGPLQIRWPVLESALKCDFDAVLHSEHAGLASKIFDTISRSSPAPEISRVLALLVDGFANARNLLGFIEHWKLGLAQSPHGIWSDEGLVSIFATHVETTLTPGQIEKLVAALGNVKQWVILDAVLRGVSKPETAEKLANGTVFDDIFISAKQITDWRAWKVFVRMADLKPSLSPKMVKSATKMVATKYADQKRSDFAAEIILFACQQPECIPDLEDVHKMFQLISLKWFAKDATSRRFATSVTAAVIGRYLRLLESVDAEPRNSWVDSLLIAALNGDPDAAALWRAMLSDSEFYECPSLKDSALSGILKHLAPNLNGLRDITTAIKGPHKAPVEDPKVSFLVDSLMQFPLEAFRRTNRQIILDELFTLDTLGYVRIRPLIDKLWRVSNMNSYLATSAKCLSFYFKRPDAVSTGRKVLRHTVANRRQPKTKEYIHDILKTIRKHLSRETVNDQNIVFGWVLVTELWPYRDSPSLGISNQLESVRTSLLNILVRSIRENSQLDSHSLSMWRDLRGLDYQDQHRQEVSVLVQRIAGLLLGHRELKLSGDIWTEGVAFICWAARKLDEAIAATALVIYALQQVEVDRHTTIQEYHLMAKRLDAGVHLALLANLCRACTAGELDDVAWTFLGRLVDTIQRPSTDVSQVITRIQIDLARYLPRAPSSTVHLAVAEALTALLESHRWSATQYTVDSTFAALTFVCSPSCGLSPSATSSNEIYLSSVRLLTKIISLHRQRIRGRYHLVVNLLKRLMTCLFIPRAIRRKTDTVSHPPWITAPLGIDAARAFSRVVQVFCDPAVSSVRNQKAELTDSERTKERRRVSAVVGPVLEFWVQKTLEENMEVEMRKEARGAVETVLEVLGKDGVARVSGSISAEGRAVVKGLWKDFGARPRERV